MSPVGPALPPPSARAAQRVGQVLKGKWRLDALIGVGGMSSVYSATHRNGSRVAIKILNPEYAAQPEFVERFMREGYVANKINHPASVLVLDDDIDEGCAFLVMELLSGHSLERFARRGSRRMPLDQIFHVADQVLDLLTAAHSHGILHRDIKPANIHLTATGAVKVLDFGIARLAERVGDAAATQTGAALGTPSYMPPEQARGRWNMVDPRTDLWALGATMHALIIGERPRRAETVQEETLLAMTTPLTSLRELAPTTPPAVVAFMDCATGFEMDQRFPDAMTMQRALRQLASDVALVAVPPPPASMPGGAPHTGPEPGSYSGPRFDTARMVVPVIARHDASQSTFQATENTASPAPRPSRTRALAAGAAVAVTLAVGAVVAVRATRQPAPVEAETVFAAPAEAPAAPPTSALPAPLAPAPIPSASAAPTPPQPAVLEFADDRPPAPPAAGSAPPSAAPAPQPATTPPPQTPQRRGKPGASRIPNTSAPIFDERF